MSQDIKDEIIDKTYKNKRRDSVRLVVRDLYLDHVLDAYKNTFGLEKVSFDDETGIYKLHRVNLKIKSWNKHVEPLIKTGFNSDNTIANLFKFMQSTEKYWFEFKEDENVKEKEE